MDTTAFLNVGIVGVIAALISRVVLSGKGEKDESDVARRLTGKAGGAKEDAPDLLEALVRKRRKRGIDAFAETLSKPLGSEYERSQLSLKLAQAGLRQPDAVSLFLAAKFIAAAAGLVAGGVFQWKFGKPSAVWYEALAWPVGGFCLGFYIPQFWLNSMITSRSQKIGRGLADSLDMLVVMVEAGLGLDAGIQRCADEMQNTYPEIADEWRLSARETQMGLTRSEAMRKMADRTNVPEMRSLVAILTQAERFGTSVATALRVHAEGLRTKRRQSAEEAAAKTAVKLVFPLILCIFPTIFMVLAGPAAIKMMGAIK